MRPVKSPRFSYFAACFLATSLPVVLWGQLRNHYPYADQDFYYGDLSDRSQNLAALHQQWIAEKDAVQKTAEARYLMAVAYIQDPSNFDMMEEIVRGGPNGKKLILPPDTAREVFLRPLITLDDAETDDDASQYEHTQATIFRRITRNRIEAWTSLDGWLFDSNGSLLNHVLIPLRDGDRSPWYGAFLPSGTWITTDLWADDRQLNCFNSKGKWLWELAGRQMFQDPMNQKQTQTIHWARSAKDGRRWIASVGEYNENIVCVTPDGHSRPLTDSNPWNRTYPQAMLAKGGGWSLRIPSSNGKAVLWQQSSSHGWWGNWPRYSIVPDQKHAWVIPYGDVYFGFWPDSHNIWAEGNEPKNLNNAGGSAGTTKKMWFFTNQGAYQGELDAQWLGDAADEESLLFQDTSYEVLTVSPDLKVTEARRFTWADHQTAQPVAIYNALRLGFFNNLQTGEVVEAKW